MCSSVNVRHRRLDRATLAAIAAILTGAFPTSDSPGPGNYYPTQPPTQQRSTPVPSYEQTYYQPVTLRWSAPWPAPETLRNFPMPVTLLLQCRLWTMNHLLTLQEPVIKKKRKRADARQLEMPHIIVPRSLPQNSVLP
ncbi:hypothetical protein EDB84DRAFT_1679373 [Lactarius hengduanensis]|nr:hypothetical protein EDB84DRAFT_1679373 [Lactarius hengduanensis]